MYTVRLQDQKPSGLRRAPNVRVRFLSFVALIVMLIPAPAQHPPGSETSSLRSLSMDVITGERDLTRTRDANIRALRYPSPRIGVTCHMSRITHEEIIYKPRARSLASSLPLSVSCFLVTPAPSFYTRRVSRSRIPESRGRGGCSIRVLENSRVGMKARCMHGSLG